MKRTLNKEGVHYSLFEIESMDDLRALFPSGEADELNLCLFSTSGVHGTYRTIEECEASLAKPRDQWGEDDSAELTVMVLHPRLCTLRFGHVEIEARDIPLLKKLRATSSRLFSAMGEIGV